MFVFYNCTNKVYVNYELIKKYPPQTPDMELIFNSDTTGIILKKGNNKIITHFSFKKSKKYFLIITNVEGDNFVILNKGDTLIHYKKELYILHNNAKLIFRKK